MAVVLPMTDHKCLPINISWKCLGMFKPNPTMFLQQFIIIGTMTSPLLATYETTVQVMNGNMRK